MKYLVYALVLMFGFAIVSVSAYAQPIWLQRVEDESAVVMWISANKEPESVVYIDPNGISRKSSSKVNALQPTIDGDIAVNVHEAELVDLCPGTVYKYRVGGGSERELTTAKPSAHYRFAFTSNPNSFAPGKAQSAWASITKARPDFVVISGDISSKSTNANYLQFVARGQPLLSQVATYTVQGNHDNRDYTTYDSWFNNETRDRYSERFYAFDKGPIRFVMINDMAARPDMFPADWFRRAIERAGSKWVAVVANGNWRRFDYMQQQFALNKSGIDMLLTSGSGNQYIDNGQLIVESGGDQYVYHAIDVSLSRIDVTGYNSDGGIRGSTFIVRKALEAKPMPPINVRVEPWQQQ